FGGRRLAVIQNEHLLVVTAKYPGPVEAYGMTGRKLWSRKDLIGVQHVNELAATPIPLLGVGLDDRPFKIIEASTGKDVCTVDDATVAYASGFDGKVLFQSREKSVYLADLSFKVLWRRSLSSFTLLHAAFSPCQVAIAEVAGHVRCFNLAGEPQWELRPERDHHFLRLSWNGTGYWMGVDWN